MSTPPAARVAELAPFWASVSVHEAGHAVIGALLDLPVTEVRLYYRRASLMRWEVAGYTTLGNRGGVDIDECDSVLFNLAGLEAEALHIASVHGIPLDRARAEVQNRHANQGDVNEIAAALPDAGITFDQALARVNSALCEQWQTITYLAETLREHRRITGADVARLI